MPLSLAVRGQHSHPEDPFPDPYPSVSLKKKKNGEWLEYSYPNVPAPTPR